MVLYIYTIIKNKNLEIMKTFIIIDSLGSIHAHIKSENAFNAKLTYTEGLLFLEDMTFVITNEQYDLIKNK